MPKGKLIQVQFVNALRRADNSIKLNFLSELEVTSQELAQWDEIRGRSGYLYFSDRISDESTEEIDNIDFELGQNKTQSERIRNVLYKCWEHDSEGFSEFKNYYIHKTEKIINHYKNQLPDL